MPRNRLALALLALVTMFGGMSPALAASGPSGRRAIPAKLLDLSAVVPLPSEVGEGYVNNGGQYFTPDLFSAAGEGSKAELAKEGFAGNVGSFLSLPNPQDPTVTIQDLGFHLYQFGDAANARDFLGEIAAPAGFVRENNPPSVGEDTTVWHGYARENGRGFQARTLHYHIGEIAILITIDDYADPTVGLPRTDASLEKLADIVNTRLAAVQQGDYGGLALLTLHVGIFPNAYDPSVYAAYIALNGKYVPRFGYAAADDARFKANSSGLIDDYESVQAIGAADSPHLVFVYLFRFKDEASAAAFLHVIGATMAASTDVYTSFDKIADAPTFGDASAAFAYGIPARGNSPAVKGKRIYAQTGAIVAGIGLENETEPSLDVAGQLMTAQLACIAAGSCLDSVPLPS